VGAPVASGGPYYLAQYVPNQRILLKRNPNYRGHRPAGYDRILYTIGQDQATAEQQVSDGTADYMADGVPPLDQTRLYDEYGPGHDPLPIARASRAALFTLLLIPVGSAISSSGREPRVE
jgi:ABC-type transport system substrate-binding protein